MLPALQADIVTLKPSADTTLFQPNPDANLGGADSLVAGSTAEGLKTRAVLKFDLAGSVPAGATITSASLTIQVVKQSGSPSDSTFDLRRLLVDWGEGAQTEKTGTAASPGEATWNARMAPSTLWKVPGGAEGSDFSQVKSGSRPISGPASYTFTSTAASISDAQLWLDQPSANFGWILLTEAEGLGGTARRIGSREDPPNAPVLTIEYAVGATASRIDAIKVSKQTGSISWTPRSGFGPPFQLQTKAQLTDTNWTNLGVPLTGTNTTFPAEASAGFFRVQGTESPLR